jgi:hypothetical protein
MHNATHTQLLRIVSTCYSHFLTLPTVCSNDQYYVVCTVALPSIFYIATYLCPLDTTAATMCVTHAMHIRTHALFAPVACDKSQQCHRSAVGQTSIIDCTIIDYAKSCKIGRCTVV